MAFAIGLQALRSLCGSQKTMDWHRAKLSPKMFSAMEQPAFMWVSAHLKLHHVLPKLETLTAAWPTEFMGMETPEPPSYYLRMLENRFFYKLINDTNLKAQEILKADQDAYEKALDVMRGCVNEITEQRYRLRILDVGKELTGLVMDQYHQTHQADFKARFGWPYLDQQSGWLMPGEVISFVGRPAMGKTWMMLYVALENWHNLKENVLFASMEMMTLPVAQRVAAMYTHCGIGQLKIGGFPTKVYDKFALGLKELQQEQAKLYIVDGNLAASVDDLYDLADILGCRIVVTDGGYLVKHPNPRIDRFTRVAENVERIKQRSTDQEMISLVSWQLNRQADKQEKDGKKVGLETIGYSDAIGQISSIVCGLFQEEGVETMKKRKVDVMKGRGGEIGEFSIGWDFAGMNFQQVDPAPNGVNVEQMELDWI